MTKCVCFFPPLEPEDSVNGAGPAKRRISGDTEEMFLLQNGVWHSRSEGSHGPRHILYEWPHHHPDHTGWLIDKLLAHETAYYTSGHMDGQTHTFVWSSEDTLTYFGRLNSLHNTNSLPIIVGWQSNRISHNLLTLSVLVFSAMAD